MQIYKEKHPENDNKSGISSISEETIMNLIKKTKT